MINLERLMGFKPTQASIANILGVNQAAIAGRAKRNSSFSEEELQQIESFFAIDLTENGMVELPYYPSLLKGLDTKRLIRVSVSCIPEYNPDDDYIVISNIGNGMMPTILDSDKLILLTTKVDAILDSRVYLFEYQNKLYVRRLANNIKHILVKSDVPDFNDITITDVENVKIRGRVVALVRDLA